MKRKLDSISHMYFVAQDFASCKYVVDNSMTVVIDGLCNRLTAGNVKLQLLQNYAFDTKVMFYQGKDYIAIDLVEIDQQTRYSATTQIIIEPIELASKSVYNYSDLMRIMSRLTASDGCEWDKAQTHQSILINAIEEAYEVVDAIESGDLAAIVEELGDLLLQPIFHADIAARSGEFDISDIITNLCHKLVSRHSHIFGLDIATSPNESLKIWEKNKQIEKNQTTLTDQLNSIPQKFPSLLRAAKVIRKLQKAGLEQSGSPMETAEITDKLVELVKSSIASNVDLEVILHNYITGRIKTLSTS